jgi:muramoyltetrapeptide carboxypeptidase LdcA involved in peptidoglycan recycling
MQSLVKPKKLTSGDTVAAITLSWGGAATFPDRYRIGKKRLEEVFGLTVIETKHAMRDADWIYRNPQARAEDLMSAFSDSNVSAIIATIGGEDSIRLLPYIDYSVLKCNPKIVLGFSDTTVGHFICLKAGLGSFYGPSVMTAFAENIQMHEYFVAIPLEISHKIRKDGQLNS